jgi:hypothetical protein
MEGKADHVPPSRAEVMNKYGYSSTLPYASRAYVGTNLPQHRLIDKIYVRQFYNKVYGKNLILFHVISLRPIHQIMPN